jgi:hypothetical protein
MVTDIEKKIKPRSVADPVPGSGIRWIPSGSRILDPGWVKSWLWIRNPGPGGTTLIIFARA